MARDRGFVFRAAMTREQLRAEAGVLAGEAANAADGQMPRRRRVRRAGYRQPGYPTAEQVWTAAETTRIKPATLRAVLRWKREFRGRLRTTEAIAVLLDRLGAVYSRPVTVRFRAGTSDHYDLPTRTIYLNAARLSVITALHEFAHHLRGISEMKACAWSVAVFARTFPASYGRARFEGHLLRVPRRRRQETNR
jgi:hypothetical protein